MRLRNIAITLLTPSFMCIAALAFAGETCERNATIGHVGKRPSAGSGIWWFVVELKMLPRGGDGFPAYLTYFGAEQRLPNVGDVCRLCWQTISFGTMHGNAISGDGVSVGGPGSEPWRSISKLSCGSVDYTKP